MSPLVSLLVPVFNRAGLLGPCLDSALAQTLSDIEVVVVDGASTDGTWDVCQRYAAADPRVRVFRDPVNTGPVRGWWRCVEEARGTFATFLWSDDMLLPEFLARTVPFLALEDVAFAFTAAEVGAEPGTGEIHYSQPSRLLSSKEFIDRALHGSDLYPVSPACGLFRLGDLRQSFMMELPTNPAIDLSATGAGTDLLLYLITALRYPRVACLSEPLAFFRSHAGSITSHGRGGQVALHYALAKGWFAKANGHGQHAEVILARHWLHEMRVSRRLVSPIAAARRYRHIVGPGDLVRTALIQLVRAITAVAAERTRGTGHSSTAEGRDRSDITA